MCTANETTAAPTFNRLKQRLLDAAHTHGADSVRVLLASFKCGQLCDLKLEQAESFAEALERLAARPPLSEKAFRDAQAKAPWDDAYGVNDARDRALFDAGVAYGKREEQL